MAGVISQTVSHGTRVSRSALPKRDPTEQRLAISSRQADLDIGSGKSKRSMQRCYDAVPLNKTLVLRSYYALPGKAAAESWWSHHPSNDNDVMHKSPFQRRRTRCRPLASAESVRRLSGSSGRNIMVSNYERPGRRERLSDLRRQFRGCRGLAKHGTAQLKRDKNSSLGHSPIRSTDLRRSPEWRTDLDLDLDSTNMDIDMNLDLDLDLDLGLSCQASSTRDLRGRRHYSHRAIPARQRAMDFNAAYCMRWKTKNPGCLARVWGPLGAHRHGCRRVGDDQDGEAEPLDSKLSAFATDKQRAWIKRITRPCVFQRGNGYA